MDSKWVIEKCRRGRSCWHVYSPASDDPDDISLDWEFKTGDEAIAFVRRQLAQ